MRDPCTSRRLAGWGARMSDKIINQFSQSVQFTTIDQRSGNLAQLRKAFQEVGYVPLPGFLTSESLAGLRREVVHLESIATRRDFTMECMSESPRHMTTVGGHIIARESTLIPDLYEDIELIRYLRSLTGLDLITVPDIIERHVINYLHQPGDTHGAHFDDYPVALLIFLETPTSPDDGGLLEFVANAGNLSAIETGDVTHAFHLSGDAYVLRSDTTAHRVTPLRRECRRVALNFAYATPDSCTIATPSASLLYG